jgi:hypothetical protein
MNPEYFIPGISDPNYVTQLYVSRNVTVVVGLIAALSLRSHKALFAVLIVSILTDISDVVAVYAFNVEVIKSSVPMVMIVLIVPELLALGHLFQRIRREGRQ